MARPRAAQPVKLICGLLSGDRDLLQRAKQLLKRRFGTIDLESDIWPFYQTDYYEEEMGADLKRQFVSFAETVDPAVLADAKHGANAIEEAIAHQCGGLDVARPVNLDPGYIDLDKLVLASTKTNSHRIYIGQNMYAEVTLAYADGGWKLWPWTYPDYHREEYHEYFTMLRERLRKQRRELPDTFGEAKP